MSSACLTVCSGVNPEPYEQSLSAWAKAGLLSGVVSCSLESLVKSSTRAACRYADSNSWRTGRLDEVLSRERYEAVTFAVLRAERLGAWGTQYELESAACESIKAKFVPGEVLLRAVTVGAADPDAVAIPEAFSPMWDLHLLHDSRMLVDNRRPYVSVEDEDVPGLCALTALCAGGGWTFSSGAWDATDQIEGVTKPARIVRPQVRVVFGEKFNAVNASEMIFTTAPWPEPSGLATQRVNPGVYLPMSFLPPLTAKCGFDFHPLQSSEKSDPRYWWQRLGRCVKRGAKAAKLLFTPMAVPEEVSDTEKALAFFKTLSPAGIAPTVEALRLSGMPGLSTGIMATPKTWETLRQALYGLVDGSDMPEGISCPPPLPGAEKGTRLIWADPSVVAPPPDAEPFVLPPEYAAALGVREIDPVDTMLSRRFQQMLDPEGAGRSTSPGFTDDFRTVEGEEFADDYEEGGDFDDYDDEEDGESPMGGSADPPSNSSMHDSSRTNPQGRYSGSADPPSYLNVHGLRVNNEAGEKVDSTDSSPGFLKWDQGSVEGQEATPEAVEDAVYDIDEGADEDVDEDSPGVDADSPDREEEHPAAPSRASTGLDGDEPPTMETLRGIKQRWDDWQSQWRWTALWRLGDHLAESTEAAANGFAANKKRISSDAEHEAARSSRRVFRWVLIVCGVLAVVGVIAIIERRFGVIGNLFEWGFVTTSLIDVWLLIGFACLAFAVLVYFGKRAAQDSLDYFETEERRRERNEAARHCAVEMTRLHTASVEFNDHQRVIRTMLHEPFGRVGRGARRFLVDAPDESVVPASMILGQARVPEDRLEVICKREREFAMKKGWIVQAHTEVTEEWGEHFGKRINGDFPTPDEDNGAAGVTRYRDVVTDEDLPGTREHFRNSVVANDDLRHRAVRLRAAKTFSSYENLTDLLGPVQVLRGPVMPGLSAGEFLSLPNNASDSFDASLFSPSASPHAHAQSPEESLDAAGPTLQLGDTNRPYALFANWRMLVSDPITPSHLAGWQAPPDVPIAPATLV